MKQSNKPTETAVESLWPPLPWNEWKETCETLHMWTQIVGKVKLELAPFLNQYWEVAFYVTPRGLTTASIPYRDRAFEINFDFIDHNLSIATSGDAVKFVPLIPRSVADFYQEFMATLKGARDRCLNQYHAGRNPGTNPLRRGSHPRVIRPGIRHQRLAYSI